MKCRGRGGAVLAALLLLAAPAASAEITAYRIPLNPEDESVAEVAEVGELEYRGGLELHSNDSLFGGLSSLIVAPDGSWFLSASDRGVWVRARLGYTPEGWLASISDLTIDQMSRRYGETGRVPFDAESLAHAGSEVLVAFEQQHTLAQYATAGPGRPTGRPRPITPPPDLDAAPRNLGVEALARLSDGVYLAITEGLAAGPGALRGWIGGPAGGWQRLEYAVSEGFVPTGATRAPGGEILVVERHFSWVGGFASRVVALDPSAIRPGARLSGRVLATLRAPLSVDNFEGIAARRAPGGTTLVYLVSDDNFNALQRTLLLMFAYRGRGP